MKTKLIYNIFLFRIDFVFLEEEVLNFRRFANVRLGFCTSTPRFAWTRVTVERETKEKEKSKQTLSCKVYFSKVND